MGARGRAALRAVGGAHVPRAGAAATPAARHRRRAARTLRRQLAAGVQRRRGISPHLPRVPAARARQRHGQAAAAAAAGAPGHLQRAGRLPRVQRAERRRARERRPGAAVAVPAGGAGGRRARHLLGGSPRRRRVPSVGPGRGGAALGPPQAEAQHELRQAVPSAQILLRQEHHEQGTRQAVRVSVQLGGADGGVPGAGGRRASLLALPHAALLHAPLHALPRTTPAPAPRISSTLALLAAAQQSAARHHALNQPHLHVIVKYYTLQVSALLTVQLICDISKLEEGCGTSPVALGLR